MRKRINTGVYIGQYDTDVAAWFNLLQDNHMSRAKCIMALLCAYAMKQKLPIGTIDINAPLIKTLLVLLPAASCCLERETVRQRVAAFSR